MSHQRDIENLLVKHNRRLQALKERQALYGFDTPIAILTEIEDIEAEITKLLAELETVKQVSVGGINIQADLSVNEQFNIGKDVFEDKEKQYRLVLNWDGETSLRAFDLSKRNLLEIKLKGSDLVETNLQGANLQQANLQDANLREANLQNANLHKSKLQRANLHRAVLREANLQLARLHKTNLKEVDLQEANLQGADLRRANLSGTQITINQFMQVGQLQKASMPDGNLYDGRFSLTGDVVLCFIDWYGIPLPIADILEENEENLVKSVSRQVFRQTFRSFSLSLPEQLWKQTEPLVFLYRLRTKLKKQDLSFLNFDIEGLIKYAASWYGVSTRDFEQGQKWAQENGIQSLENLLQSVSITELIVQSSFASEIEKF